jgi:hypothetical protein
MTYIVMGLLYINIYGRFTMCIHSILFHLLIIEGHYNNVNGISESVQSILLFSSSE